MLVSVVTPYLAATFDAAAIRAELGPYLAALAAQHGPLEIVLSSTAPTRQDPVGPLLATLAGKAYPHRWRCVHRPFDPARGSPPTRAAALNAGLAEARGEVAVLLHVDCRLPPGAAASIRDARRAGYRAGAFPKHYHANTPLLALQARWLNAWSLGVRRQTVGTNAVWVDRSLWLERPLTDWPLLEDFDLSAWLLRRLGRGGIHVSAETVIVNAGKYLRYGTVGSIATNAAVLALWRWARVDPAVLRDELYSRRRLAVGTARFWPSLAAGCWRALRAPRRRCTPPGSGTKV